MSLGKLFELLVLLRCESSVKTYLVEVLLLNRLEVDDIAVALLADAALEGHSTR